MINHKVHFVGIGGSGLSGIAMIAKAQGYEISGCDLNLNTPYITEIKNDGVQVYEGQNVSHIKDSDLVVTTPAVFFQNKNNPEIIKAKEMNKVLTGAEFLGKYLQQGKVVICIAGTHGKSTTTAMASLMFEKAGLNPSVMIGANVHEWGANYRAGKGEVFITEADEFFDSFLNYNSDVVILNNIEFDHPDYFKTEKEMFDSFAKFIGNLKGKKILIYNNDDAGVRKLLEYVGKKQLEKFHLFGYSTKDLQISLTPEETEFQFEGDTFKLKVPGKYNVSNALGVIILAKLFKIQIDKIKTSLFEFEGIGRRLEFIGEKKGIKVYDDYAHHPTAIKVTLGALKQKYPKQRLLVIVEPHTFSRTKALLPLYKGVFDDADEVIIAPIFKSRDSQDFGVSGQSIVDVSNYNNISYVDNFEKIVNKVCSDAKSGDVVVVMGAGESYKLAREILKSLEVDKYAELLWNFNNIKQPLKKSDAILVLGSNDTRVAEMGVELFLKNYAPLIIFSGGFGRLTQYLYDKSEAEVFADIAISLGIPKEKILIENKSTNTEQNIVFTKDLLRKKNIEISTFIVVQKPYMLRRAYATFKKQWPNKKFVVTGPKIDYKDYPNEIITKELLINVMVGDTQRIEEYPKRGFQISQKIPKKVWDAYLKLVEMGYTKHLIKD